MRWYDTIKYDMLKIQDLRPLNTLKKKNIWLVTIATIVNKTFKIYFLCNSTQLIFFLNQIETNFSVHFRVAYHLKIESKVLDK